MEGLTRLVSESLARHGFDRPLDYRRLHWSRWFRCESHHSLLFVPSKPGVFALAEEVMDLNVGHVGLEPGTSRVGTDAFARPATLSEAQGRSPEAASRKPEAHSRMLAVTGFFEADDMAFVLDRMLARQHPMRAHLESGRYFVRYVVIEDHSQRRSIVNALNQWIASSAERATGIGSHFATSLELTPAIEKTHVGTGPWVRPASEASAVATNNGIGNSSSFATSQQPDSETVTNVDYCPFPSGF